MPTFRELTKAVREPGRTLMLEPWVFADGWDSKPKEAVCVGLRLMGDTDKTTSRAEAERLADEAHPKRGPNWVDAFNDALVRQVVALGICDPNNVLKPSPTLMMPQDQVGFALTSRGARFIFEAIDRYEIEASAIGIEANREEIEELAKRLKNLGPVALLDMRPSLRRLISHVLDELRALDR